MQGSASPNDTQYLLRGLDHSLFGFKVNETLAQASDTRTLTDAQRGVLDFLRLHPGETATTLFTHVQQFAPHTYHETRNLVITLLDMKLLQVARKAPLEQVDFRYERVAACDVCGSPSNNHPIIIWKHNTPIVRCSTCGLIYANPRWKAEFLFGYYNEDYWEAYEKAVQAQAAGFQDWQDDTVGWVEPVRKNNRFLDVGCATGLLLSRAKLKGWDVYGLELSPVSAKLARSITGAQIHVGTLDTATYPDGYFDVITLMDVIEHLQSPRAYIERIATLVRPGGMLVVSTPNIHSLAYRLLGPGNWDVVGPNGHLYYFAPRTMARLLHSTGFDIHTMHTSGTTQAVWKKWLRFRGLQWLARFMPALSYPVVKRFLLGDALYVAARRR